jgi:hypothetical protein
MGSVRYTGHRLFLYTLSQDVQSGGIHRPADYLLSPERRRPPGTDVQRTVLAASLYLIESDHISPGGFGLDNNP